MRIVLILFPAVLLIAFADAQRKSNITKPVVNLEKRPRAPEAWNPPPEERRTLPIFPKNRRKFVVTPKTVVKNDDTAKEGLPTKIPLVRRFTMQDGNDKDSWYFAPREPLMKIKRFTVTLAPPKSNGKGIDVIESENSKKVNTVISNAKIEQPSVKNLNPNKSNIIDTMQIKKMEPPASKHLEKFGSKLITEEISEITKVNDSQIFDIIHMNDNSRLKSDKVSKEYANDIRRLNDEVSILNAYETKYESKNDHSSIKFDQTATLDSEISKHVLKSRAVNLNELKYAIEQKIYNALTMDSEESNSNNTAQILSFNDLEILLEKIVNNTKSSAADFNDNHSSNSTKNETQGTLEDKPKFDVTIPNTFYDVISLSSDEEKNTNFEQDFLGGSVLRGAQIIENSEKASGSEPIVFNGEEDVTENVSDSLIVGNLQSLMNFMQQETASVEKHNQSNIVAHDGKETKTYTKYTITKNPLTYNGKNDEKNSINDTRYEIQTEYPKEINSYNNDSLNSMEILLEMYESNISLSSEELSAGVVDEIPIENVYLSDLEIPNEPFIDSVSVDEISNESISDTSNNNTEERSNESLIGTLTDEEISNKPSSIIAGEEFNKSAESSQEPAEGALTNRFKRSNNIIEEENLPTTVSGFKYTGNEITLSHDLSYKNINA